jgi:hypothetical protein
VADPLRQRYDLTSGSDRRTLQEGFECQVCGRFYININDPPGGAPSVKFYADEGTDPYRGSGQVIGNVVVESLVDAGNIWKNPDDSHNDEGGVRPLQTRRPLLPN